MITYSFHFVAVMLGDDKESEDFDCAAAPILHFVVAD